MAQRACSPLTRIQISRRFYLITEVCMRKKYYLSNLLILKIRFWHKYKNLDTEMYK